MLDNLIIPVLNRYDLLFNCLRSIDYPIQHLLIIDNGGSCKFNYKPPSVEKLTMTCMPSNLGVAASWNLGIKAFPHANRWFFASNDMAYMPGALEKLSEARRDEITLSDMFPYWHTFCIGDEAVSRLGLFDEGLYPAYFEDTDMERRARHHGVPIRHLPIATTHDNSSTIKSDGNFMAANLGTFSSNQRYYEQKVAMEDYGQGGWSLERRRMNAWDAPR